MQSLKTEKFHQHIQQAPAGIPTGPRVDQHCGTSHADLRNEQRETMEPTDRLSTPWFHQPMSRTSSGLSSAPREGRILTAGLFLTARGRSFSVRERRKISKIIPWKNHSTCLKKTRISSSIVISDYQVSSAQRFKHVTSEMLKAIGTGARPCWFESEASPKQRKGTTTPPGRRTTSDTATR